jgi:hypothetical protein
LWPLERGNSVRRKLSRRKISLALIAVVLLLNALGCGNGKVRAAAPPPPPMVEVAPVIQHEL